MEVAPREGQRIAEQYGQIEQINLLSSNAVVVEVLVSSTEAMSQAVGTTASTYKAVRSRRYT
jgi:hypothetical protein